MLLLLFVHSLAWVKELIRLKENLFFSAYFSVDGFIAPGQCTLQTGNRGQEGGQKPLGFFSFLEGMGGLWRGIHFQADLK